MNTPKDKVKPSLFIRTLKLVMSRFGKVKVIGAGNLDSPVGKVVVCNHVGWADPLWMGYAVLPRTLNQMAKKELFDNPVSRWFVRSGGGFPVDRGRPSAATFKHAISLVEQGKLVLIFPVGTRVRENTEAKRGAATIALHAKGEIVPAYYDGPERLSLFHLLRRPEIQITFGSPIVIPPDLGLDKATALQITAHLDQAMKDVSRSTRVGDEAIPSVWD